MGWSQLGIAYAVSREAMVVLACEARDLAPSGAIHVVSVNQAFSSLEKEWGGGRSSCLGMLVEELAPLLGFSAKGGEALRTRVAAALDATATPRRERFVDPWPTSGDARPLEVSLVPVQGDQGTRGVLLVAHEVGDRQATALALRESEDKLSKAFRASPGAMAINELRTGIFVEINDGYTEAFGYSRQELIGRCPDDLQLWLDLEDQKRFVRQVREAGSVRDFEALGRTKAGQTITCVINAELGDLGGVPCLVSSLRDVTQQRRVEAERAALEARLRQVQKLESLGTLAGGIAHDFNNILTTIMSCVELALLDVEEPAAVREHLGELRRASERARDLVKQILAFSRRQPPSRKSLRLEPLLDEVATALRSTLPQGLTVEVQLAADVPSVLGDSSQLHRVLTNIGTNAGQAMTGRAGRLVMGLESVWVDAAWSAAQPELRPGHYARISVEDTGHGMAEETLRHIFDPFFTTREHGGMGLGLAVVHGIVRDHDGAVNVHSAVGQGTRFEVYLPEHVGLSPTLVLPVAVPRGIKGAHETILLVDDEPLVCKGLQSVLERLSYRVTAFTDPLEAMRCYAAAPQDFALVLTDLTMPKLAGIDLAKSVLALRPEARVILMTGFSVTWTPEKVRSLGLRDLLWKPISLDELATAVHRALAPAIGSA